MSLIPEIEIGKKYLWRLKPIEKVCPNCGVLGNSWCTKGDFIVRVVADSSEMGALIYHCCGYREVGKQDGWYACKMGDGYLAAVPYTQLEPIEEELNEESNGCS